MSEKYIPVTIDAKLYSKTGNEYEAASQFISTMNTLAKQFGSFTCNSGNSNEHLTFTIDAQTFKERAEPPETPSRNDGVFSSFKIKAKLPNGDITDFLMMEIMFLVNTAGGHIMSWASREIDRANKRMYSARNLSEI